MDRRRQRFLRHQHRAVGNAVVDRGRRPRDDRTPERSIEWRRQLGRTCATAQGADEPVRMVAGVDGRQPPTWTPMSVPTVYVTAAAEPPSSTWRTLA